MARAKVREIGAAPTIQPQAAPVNTYVRPADPAPSPLHDVARGLAAFDDGLSGFLAKRQGERDKVDEIRAIAAFNKNNQMGWAEAVRQGLVPANASPIFVETYKKAQGNLAGIQLREKFNRAYLSWDGRNSNDPTAFQGFIGQFIADNIGTEDPEILAGLVPHLTALTEDGYEVFGKESAESVYNGSVHTQAAIAGETIDWANQDGLSNGNGTDYEMVKADLLALREEALSSGIRMEDFDKQLVDTIRDKAVEHGDPELLNLLDEVWPGYEVKLSSVPEFRDIKDAGLSSLETRARQQQADMDKRQAAADKKAENLIASTAARLIATDPLATVPEDLIREWEKYDPMARKKIAEIRSSLVNEAELERPHELIAIERLIQGGASAKDILELAGPDGPIKDVATLKAALDRVEKREKAMREGTGILTGQTARRLLGTIKERTMPQDWDQPFAPDGVTDEGLEAIRDFEAMLLEWDAANPQAGLIEREEAVNKIGQLILGRIDTEERQYTSEADAAALKAQAAAVEATAAEAANASSEVPEAPAGGPEGGSWRDRFKEAMEIDAGISRPREADTEAYAAWRAAETDRLYAGDAPPSLDDMDTSYRRKLEEDAAQLGMKPEELNMKIWESIREAVSPEDRKAAEAPAEAPTQTVTMTTAKGDKQVEFMGADEEFVTVKMEDGQVIKFRRTDFEDGSKELKGADGSPVPIDGVDSEVTNSIGSTIDKAVAAGHEAAFQSGTKTVSAGRPEIGRVAPMLDLLGKSEGTDKRRGYNETLNYGAYTGGDVDLVNMTLGEIDALQTKMLRHPKNSWNSSALGRYQIVRTTLRKLKSKMGLSDDEKFTPELQDRFALELLKGRGLDKWLAGKMDDKTFMNNIAKEWASAPTDKGVGYYDGQNAHVSPEQVLAAFKQVRGFGEAARGGGGVPKAYANIPANEVAQFMEWNSDPIANHEKNLSEINPKLASVVRRAQEIADVKFVVGSGKRDADKQAKAVEWGWSKTHDSDHVHSDGAVDLWPLDDKQAVKFDKGLQLKIVAAMKQAAKELGVTLDVGAEWKSFKDLPHFALKA